MLKARSCQALRECGSGPGCLPCRTKCPSQRTHGRRLCAARAETGITAPTERNAHGPSTSGREHEHSYVEKQDQLKQPGPGPNGLNGALDRAEHPKFVHFFRMASPYIEGHRGRTFVVLVPGEVQDLPAACQQIHCCNPSTHLLCSFMGITNNCLLGQRHSAPWCRSS